MLLDQPILSLHRLLKTKRVSPVELVDECFESIDTHDSHLHAFITQVDRDTLQRQARDVNITSPLSGIPYVLKDAYVTAGLQTTAGSEVLKNYVPPYSATVVNRLAASGALLLGKTSQDAWGHGASTENTDFPPAQNPWDATRVAGGSTGGVAVAVAARMSAFGIGEDTGGSIRNPAGWCGISGLKVTYGRVSRYGAIAYASSLDTMGPMAKSVEDLAVVLQYVAGQDPYDATSSPHPVADYTTQISAGVKGKVIGLPREFLEEGLDPQVRQLILDAAGELAKLGAKIDNSLSLPSLRYGVAVYYLLAPSETSSNLGRYDGVRYGQDRSHFTPETMRRIIMGTYALSAGYYDAYYLKAQKVRTVILQDYRRAFAKCDLILGPISPTPATRFGELIADPTKNMLADYYTCTVNTAGIPALALPCGFTAAGLPVGMQLMGQMFSEKGLLQAGYAYQQVTHHHDRRPPL